MLHSCYKDNKSPRDEVHMVKTRLLERRTTLILCYHITSSLTTAKCMVKSKMCNGTLAAMEDRGGRNNILPRRLRTGIKICYMIIKTVHAEKNLYLLRINTGIFWDDKGRCVPHWFATLSFSIITIMMRNTDTSDDCLAAIAVLLVKTHSGSNQL